MDAAILFVNESDGSKKTNFETRSTQKHILHPPGNKYADHLSCRHGTTTNTNSNTAFDWPDTLGSEWYRSNRSVLIKVSIALLLILSGFFVIVVLLKHTSGDICESNSVVCLHEGICKSADDSYVCDCAAGYEGYRCQNVVDACAENTFLCLNGGSCSHEMGRRVPVCSCKSGFTGERCEHSTCETTEKFKRQNLNVVTIGCGGLIRIPNLLTPPTSFVVDYKPNMSRTFKNQEKNCLWTLDNIDKGYVYLLKVKVALLCGGFENSSAGAISVFDWKYMTSVSPSDYFLSRRELRYQSQSYESDSSSHAHDRKLFLGFSSSENEFGAGFLVLIDVLETLRAETGSDIVKTSSTGGIETFGPFPSYDRFTIVINPENTTATRLTVNYLDSKKIGNCYYSDTLDIYEINAKRPPNRLDRLCGSVTSSRNFTSAFPLLATYYTSSSTTGRGFQLSWN